MTAHCGNEPERSRALQRPRENKAREEGANKSTAAATSGSDILEESDGGGLGPFGATGHGTQEWVEWGFGSCPRACMTRVSLSVWVCGCPLGCVVAWSPTQVTV